MMCPLDRESACDVGIRIRGRRAGTGANPIRPVPISAGPHVNRLERKRGRIGPNVRNRRAENTDRNHQSIVRPIAGTDRTVKSLEEEMTATAPEHAWSFGKKHHYNLLKAELEDERRLALEDKYRLGSLSKDLFEDFNIVADKATSTNPWNPCST